MSYYYPRPVSVFDQVPEGYVVGLGRDVPYRPLSHLYKGTFADPGLPMCRFGWNRDGGTSYSIWRGNVGRKGVCRLCLRRAKLGRSGVEPKAGVSSNGNHS